jgi:hypothetical protein
VKKQISWSFIGAFLVSSLFVAFTSQAEEAKIAVLNPRGQPPPIKGIPLAPRLDTLAGKTVYIIDVRFPGTEILFDEMQKWFAANMPELKTVIRQKKGDYFENDPELWAEIKEKGHAVIMGVGH